MHGGSDGVPGARDENRSRVVISCTCKNWVSRSTEIRRCRAMFQPKRETEYLARKRMPTEQSSTVCGQLLSFRISSRAPSKNHCAHPRTAHTYMPKPLGDSRLAPRSQAVFAVGSHDKYRPTHVEQPDFSTTERVRTPYRWGFGMVSGENLLALPR